MKRNICPLFFASFFFIGSLLFGQAPADYDLHWSDEFDGDSLNAANWNVELGSFYWANQEQQWYTEDAISVQEGSLKITSRWDSVDNRIESGRFNSKDKREFGDGYYEARVRFTGTYHNSIFAAFWSMGYRHEDKSVAEHTVPSGRGWPSCGENDFMEWVGSDDDADNGTGNDDGLYTPFGTCHFNPIENNANTNSQGQSGWPHNWRFATNMGKAGDLKPYEWHTVGAKIAGDTCTYYFNGKPYATYFIGNQTELKEDRFIICNLAIGGSLADAFQPEVKLPTTVMEWDYVRYYVPSSEKERTKAQPPHNKGDGQ
ncbi:MAG: glycoside hydrolase family 16 protein [Bacteroidota bacterium]